MSISNRPGLSSNGTLRTVDLHLPVSDLSPIECLTFYAGLLNEVEERKFSEAPTLDQYALLARDSLRAGMRLAMLGGRQLQLDKLGEVLANAEKAVGELQHELADRDAQLLAAAKVHSAADSHLSALEGRLKALEERNKTLEERNKVLSAAAVETSRKHEAQLAAAEKREAELKGQLTTIVADSQAKFNALLAQRKTFYVRQGADAFRNLFLKSPLGQEFLRILHEDLLAAYHKTNAFIDAAADGLNWLIDRVMEVTFAHIGASKEQQAKINRETFVDDMKLEGLEEAMGIDMSLPEDWWTPVMEKAAALFVEGHSKMPGLPPVGQLVYDLPYLQALTPPRLLQINRERERSGSVEPLSSADEADIRKAVQGGESEAGPPRPTNQSEDMTERPLQPEGDVAKPTGDGGADQIASLV